MLLAVVVLLVGFEAPALEHAHAGGDHPHRHADEAELQQHHDHPGCDACDPGTFNFPSVIGVTLHVHVFWLGFEFTLPAQWVHGQSNAAPGPEGADDARSPAELVCDGCSIYPLNDEAPRLVRDRGHFEWVAPILIASAAPPPCEPRSACVVPVCGESRCALCDVARHERSGVQLA